MFYPLTAVVMYFYVSDHVAVAFINKVAKLTMQAKKLS